MPRRPFRLGDLLGLVKRHKFCFPGTTVPALPNLSNAAALPGQTGLSVDGFAFAQLETVLDRADGLVTTGEPFLGRQRANQHQDKFNRLRGIV